MKLERRVYTIFFMLRYRLVFGAVMIAMAVGLFYLDARLDRVEIPGGWLFGVFGERVVLPRGGVIFATTLLLIAFTSYELSHIFRANGVLSDPILMMISGWLGCVLIYIWTLQQGSREAMTIGVSIVALLFVGSFIRYSWGGRTAGVGVATSANMFAMVYLGLFPGFFMAIRADQSVWVVAGVILVTKSCDIGAYFTGRMIGKHKLIPWLSPGKTWEGFVGGVVISCLVSGLLVWMFHHEGPDPPIAGGDGQGVIPSTAGVIPVWYAAIAGGVIGAVGQGGDLIESLLKRGAQMKDSAATIPGFGGALDVCDSPIIVAPVAFWLLYFAEKFSLPSF